MAVCLVILASTAVGNASSSQHRVLTDRSVNGAQGLARLFDLGCWSSQNVLMYPFLKNTFKRLYPQMKFNFESPIFETYSNGCKYVISQPQCFNTYCTEASPNSVSAALACGHLPL